MIFEDKRRTLNAILSACAGYFTVLILIVVSLGDASPTWIYYVTPAVLFCFVVAFVLRIRLGAQG